MECLTGRTCKTACGCSAEITLYRGNSANYIIKPVYDSGEDVTLQEGDKILFVVRSSPDSRARVYLSKTLTMADYDEEGQLILSFAPQDTVNMQEYTYYYDLSVGFADGTFYTFIPFSKFVILPALGDVKMMTEPPPEDKEDV